MIAPAPIERRLSERGWGVTQERIAKFIQQVRIPATPAASRVARVAFR